MNRDSRVTIAEDTLRIIEAGEYNLADGRKVALRAAIEAAKAGTKLYEREALNEAPPDRGRTTTITVTAETTNEAIIRLASAGGHLGALNFASARNAGGGFLGGAQAQEEAITRSSALYPCLLTQPSYYERNRANRSLLYLDLAIYSPAVPLFRADDGGLLATPACCSIITTPAPNAGAVRQNQPEETPAILPTLRRRAELVLAIAAAENIDRLILGAWGCGVFRNDPAEVAAVFAELLRGSGRFASAFEAVVFAIHDRTTGRSVLRTFQNTFEAAPFTAAGKATP